MKLYYSPGACSMAAHIVLQASGLPFQAIAAPTKTKLLPDGSDYRAINPLGYVPLLELADGERLTECPVIMQYVADQVPAARLAPANGTMDRYRLQAWLTFVSTELHKGGFGVFFNPSANAEFKAAAGEKLAGRLRWVNEQLEGKTYVMGDAFTAADAYLFTVTNWAKPTGVDLSPYTRLLAWRERVAALPAVQATLKAEGLA
ncbi:glutathione transferase GstA [Aquabacterium sp. OR-4]|uniref:glutathione transferase GstA n=1 Tax=Aquabacterium sp. OR-4 TaxID=2978127 RepID=UPI0028C60CA0|nr:glutathione transferase GstA [Aquabacterium sp. OR-4]MDT7833684.1 glutathione transferase GstA [Aquabacterium sp. OR-4]